MDHRQNQPTFCNGDKEKVQTQNSTTSMLRIDKWNYFQRNNKATLKSLLCSLQASLAGRYPFVAKYIVTRAITVIGIGSSTAGRPDGIKAINADPSRKGCIPASNGKDFDAVQPCSLALFGKTSSLGDGERWRQ